MKLLSIANWPTQPSTPTLNLQLVPQYHTTTTALLQSLQASRCCARVAVQPLPDIVLATASLQGLQFGISCAPHASQLLQHEALDLQTPLQQQTGAILL